MPVAEPVPAPTSITRRRRSSGSSRSSAATASPSRRVAARATGASRYRSPALGSPLLKSSVSGSASPRSTSASAPPHRRNSSISVEPWSCRAASSAANASGSGGTASGNGSAVPTRTMKPSPRASTTAAAARSSNIRRNRRPCASGTPRRPRRTSGSTVSPAVRFHPSRSSVVSATDHAMRSRSSSSAARSAWATPSAARYSENGPHPAATAEGLGRKSGGGMPGAIGRSSHTTS